MAKQPGKPRTPAARQRAVEMRKQQEAAERRRTWLMRIAMITALALIAGGVGLAVALDRRGGGPDDLPGVQTFEGLDRGHVDTPVTYPQTPPVGGNHNGTPLNCGIYGEPVPNENAVHSLEHGAVWITYQTDLPEADVTALRDLVQDKNRGFIVLSPYEDLPAPVVGSAWGRQLRMTGADDPNIAEFIDFYQQGPQTLERSLCQGVGTPINP